ncbi:MAG TPA: hypothetical protein DCX06_09750 [Opitutae bacterium]|nr:hypothetical protein [Opitutae bacterium]
MKPVTTLSLLLFSLSMTACVTVDQESKTAHTKPNETQLLRDSMSENWQENWFLDGHKATLEHREGGLYFSAGTVTKRMDPEEYHAHHAVLWTKQVFEGDIRISYEIMPVDTDGFGNILLYIQAQGIGTHPFTEDITEWNELREIPGMDKYFLNMDLISLSFRENLRCRRYPWKDPEGNWYPGRGIIEPMVDYEPMVPGKSYTVMIEKTAESVRLVLSGTKSGKIYADHTWNTSQVSENREPKLIQKGRIGLRHMSTKQYIYRDFLVESI